MKPTNKTTFNSFRKQSLTLAVFLSMTGLAMSLRAQTYNVIYTFDPEDADINSVVVDPSNPSFSGIIAQGLDGDLYSTTPSGGRYGYGAAFKISPSGALTVLYAFTGGTDGANPYGGLTLGRDGNLYGTAKAGGSSLHGTAFSITPSGTMNCVHSFSVTDGAYPLAPPVEGADGNFYGTASQGGPTLGVIYKPLDRLRPA
jgi:uncharacterized repeat protein (TIGR03803 family)